MLVHFEFYCCFALDTEQDELTEDYSATFTVKGEWQPAEPADRREIGYSRGTPSTPAEFTLYDAVAIAAHNSRRGVLFTDDSSAKDKALAAWLAERFVHAVDSCDALRARLTAAAETSAAIGV